MRKAWSTIIPIITVLLVSLFLVLTIFKPGYIYFRDVTEGLHLDNLYKRYSYAYSGDVGESLAEKARVPIFYAIFGIFELGKRTGVFDDSFYVKIKILLLFILSFVAFFFTAKKLLENLGQNEERLHKKFWISLAATLGGIYYISNYWFSNRITHFGLFFSTVTLPITFFFLYSYLFCEKTQFKKLAMLLILLSIFTATPHTAIFEFFVLVTLYLTFITNRRTSSKTKGLRTFQLLLFGILYLLINSYWILPYVSSPSIPDAVLSETIVNTIGENAKFVNSIRLMGYWLTNPKDYFLQGASLLQTAVSFLPIVFLIVSIWLIRKNRNFVYTIFLLFLGGCFLATSSYITDKFYFFLMFSSPIKTLGWLFREYDKFGIILTFIYSMAISIVIYKLSNKRPVVGVATLMVFLILASNFYFLKKTLNQNYSPQTIPNDFFVAEKFLNDDKDIFNVVWFPGVPKPNWAKKEDVRYTFSNLISQKESITSRSNLINYLNYLFNEENIYSIDLGKALDLIGVKYLIIRKDYTFSTSNAYEEKIALQNSMEKVLETDLLTIYRNKEFSGIFRFYENKVFTNLGLDILKQPDLIKTDTSLLDFSDKPSNIQFDGKTSYTGKNSPLDYFMNSYTNKFIYPYDYTTKKYEGVSSYWGLGSLENINHAETNFFFDDLGLVINQFDYGRGVISAKDGYIISDTSKLSGNDIFSGFTIIDNVAFNNHDLTYTTLGKLDSLETQAPWKIIRSLHFNVTNTKVLFLQLKSFIDKELEPHFKLTFYDSEGKTTQESAYYPNAKGVVSYVVKVPEGAVTTEFSSWARPVGGKKYTYKVNNLHIYDASDNVKSVFMTFSAPSMCEGTCTVFARVLKSRIGGEIELTIGNKVLPIVTKTLDLGHNERYEWLEVGSIENSSKKPDITITNKSGFNSINSIVLLTENERSQLYQDTQKVIETNDTLPDTSIKPYFKVTEINPTMYSVSVYNSTGAGGVLAFAKPFGNSWLLSNERPVIANGYVNGWYLEKLDNKTYIVSYKPQKYFYIGVGVSAITFVALLGYSLLSKLSAREVTASELTSKSQG
ncbi:MAG: hypothetical protein ABIJ82_01425 [Patescibacteria group bacterium]